MWHKMTLMGKILLVFVGFGFGMAAGIPIGIKYAKANDGNQINVHMDGNVKKDGHVNINVEGNDQTQEKAEKEKSKWWWPF